MAKIPDSPCRKCGGDTTVHYVPSSGRDIKPTGLFRECIRCGFEERIEALDEKTIPVDEN